MRAQLNLFTNQDPSTVVAFWPVSDEAQGTEGTPMSISREKAPLEETPPAGLSAPRLTTTHGVLYQADCLDFLGALRSGGGSTFQEAQRLGRYWIGSEIGHCDAIEQRFRDFAPTTLGRKPPREVLAVLSE